MIKGVTSLLGGFAVLFSEKALRVVLWRVVLLLFVLMLAITVGMYGLAEYLAGLWLPAGDAWYLHALGWLVWLLAVLLALFTGAVSFTVLGSITVAPWLEMLATRTEVLHLGAALSDPGIGWLRPMMNSLSNAVKPLAGLLLMGLLALAVIWLPVVGQVAAMFIWGYAGFHFLSYELLDVPATRRGWDYSRRKFELARQRPFWLGFGGLSMVLMLVPVVNLLVLPAAVVALSGTLPAGDGKQVYREIKRIG